MKILGGLMFLVGALDLILYFFVDGNYGFIPYIITIGGTDYTTYAVMIIGSILYGYGGEDFSEE
tara:strand:+ start:213 stop:404 length:192 start_codon:yes stop_codon:yes gene_type:complete